MNSEQEFDQQWTQSIRPEYINISVDEYNNNAEPPGPEPTMMFDFAGFRDHNEQQLSVIGFVIENETFNQIDELLIRGSQPKTAGLAVFPSRDSIIDYIEHAYSVELIKGDIAPEDDVGEYYSGLPSISHINAELSGRSSNAENLRFLSRKQLIDGFVDPASVLPDKLPPTRE